MEGRRVCEGMRVCGGEEGLRRGGGFVKGRYVEGRRVMSPYLGTDDVKMQNYN